MPGENVGADAEDQARETRGHLIAGALALGVIGLWLLWWKGWGQTASSAFNGLTAEAAAKVGQFGDMFGGLNALFTALAFAAVFWSGLMQRTEMAMQRRELALQRKALEEQREEMERQRGVFAQQTFEATFFRVLAQCQEMHDRLTVEEHGYRGDRATRWLAELAGSALAWASTEGPDDELAARVGKRYTDAVYPRYGQYLGPYYRTLYQLFKLIDQQAGMKLADRRRYANLARAHLSGIDVFLLAINGCSEMGAGSRRFIEQFRLLKHIEIPTAHAKERPVDLAMVRACYPAHCFLSYDETPDLPARADQS